MVYHAEGMELEVIWEAFRGSVNNLFVCRNRSSASGTRYTLLVIHDRDCIKTVLGMLEGREQPSLEQGFVLRFSQSEELCFVFEYRQERKFSSFAPGQMVSPMVGEAICINLVMECLSYPLPWPFLYLTLIQDNIHIAKDNSVYFTPLLDLSDLNASHGEDHCVSSCAQLLLELLSGTPTSGRRGRKRLSSLELIRKKSAKHAYTGFPELYRDIKVTALPLMRTSWKQRFMGAWQRNQNWLFRVLLTLSVIAVLLALVVLVSQLFFGDVPLLRLFWHTFDVIGTENLHQ